MGYQENNFETKNKRFQVSGGKKRESKSNELKALSFLSTMKDCYGL